MSAEDVLREVLKDKCFYAENGGVTFSGGECLLWADFVAEVLDTAKSKGLHTAIDTCGMVRWQDIEKTLGVCDLYLYDVKCIDSAVHKKYTGVDNALILENLRRLSDTGKDIWIRIPVIPDFNDSTREMTAISEFLLALPKRVDNVTLMPYHSLGASKYVTLGLEYRYDTTKSISQDRLEEFRDIFRSRGFILT